MALRVLRFGVWGFMVPRAGLVQDLGQSVSRSWSCAEGPGLCFSSAYPRQIVEGWTTPSNIAAIRDCQSRLRVPTLLRDSCA